MMLREQPVRRLMVAALIASLGAVVALAAQASAQDAPKPAVTGTLTDGEKPVPGVKISVTAADGTEIGATQTDDKGAFLIQLPGLGVFTATLDKTTLPKDVELREGARDSLTFTIRSTTPRRLNFPLGEGTGGPTSGKFQQGLQLLVEGIKLGLIIAMCAIGLSLIFGTTGLTNFAHGELVTFGAIATWMFNNTLGMHFIPAAALGVLAGGLFGGALDLGLWRPLRRRRAGLIAMLVISIGLGIFLRYIFLFQFDGRSRPYAQYQIQRAIDFGPVSIAPKDMVSIVLSIAVLVGVATMLTKTKIGKAMRAVADNGDLASSSGIDTQRVILFVWVFGSALAALGGTLLGLTEAVRWDSGFLLLLLMFAGVTLGGLGTAYGALLGSLIVGIFVQVSTLWISTELKNVGALAILIVILLVRPTGLLGRRERIG